MSEPEWKTVAIRQAEDVFEEAIANAEQVAAQDQEMSDSLPDSQLSEEDIGWIEQHARSYDAPEGIRALQERIDAGELSWSDIASGKALSEESVQQALQSSAEVAGKVKELIDEGHEVDEIIAADPNRPATDEDFRGRFRQLPALSGGCFDVIGGAAARERRSPGNGWMR